MSLATAFSDPREFREVYQAHHGFVWHALHRFGLNGAALEDALQDVFVIAYRRRETFAGSSKAWLYAIARRVASNHRRSARRRDARADALSLVESHTRRSVPEAIIALDRYLDRLSAEDRELFVLSEVEGMTGPEISAAWGLNLNTIYTRIRKLRGSLREEAIAEQARQEQPAASARGWAALLPALKPMTLFASGMSVGWAAAILVIGVGGAAVLATPGADPNPGPEMQQSNRALAGVEASNPPPGPAGLLPLPSSPAVVAATASATVVKPAVPHKPRVAEGPQRARSAAVPEPVSTLNEENAMLARAQAALGRGEAELALRETVAHAARFPNGVLADVRAVVRIEALCALRKAPQARAEAKVLLERRPAMTSRRRLEKSCAGSPQKPSSPDMTGA
ncbi:MAG: RNA polymerase sigma factor [Nannocystales bacterium]